MNQQNHGADFYLGTQFGARPQKGPKIEKWIPPTVFELGPSFFQGVLVTHKPTKYETDFLFGAHFWARPQKGPKIEKWAPSTVFELGPSFFQGLLVTHEPTK